MNTGVFLSEEETGRQGLARIFVLMASISGAFIARTSVQSIC